MCRLMWDVRSLNSVHLGRETCCARDRPMIFEVPYRHHYIASNKDIEAKCQQVGPRTWSSQRRLSRKEKWKPFEQWVCDVFLNCLSATAKIIRLIILCHYGSIQTPNFTPNYANASLDTGTSCQQPQLVGDRTTASQPRSMHALWILKSNLAHLSHIWRCREQEKSLVKCEKALSYLARTQAGRRAWAVIPGVLLPQRRDEARKRSTRNQFKSGDYKRCESNLLVVVFSSTPANEKQIKVFP
jgi:hypothetical protein